MKNKIAFSILTALLLTLFLTKFETLSYAAGHFQDDAPRISLADAKKAYDDGTAIFFDARTHEAFEEGHIKGALLIGFDNWEKKLKNVPAGKSIIIYCSCPNEHSAAALVDEMQKKGVKNTSALLGGTMAWKDAGYPMATGK